MRSRLNEIMPAEADTPLTEAAVPDEQTFTIEAAERLDVSVGAAVARSIQLKHNVQQYIQEQRQRRTFFASIVFMVGSLLVALAKWMEWAHEQRRTSMSMVTHGQEMPANRKKKVNRS